MFISGEKCDTVIFRALILVKLQHLASQSSASPREDEGIKCSEKGLNTNEV